MKEDGGQDTNHQSGNRVDIITEECSSRASSHDLGSRSEKIKTKEEKVKEEKNETNSNEDESPFLGRMGAARLGYLTPGGVLHVRDVIDLLFGFLLFDISHDESLLVLFQTIAETFYENYLMELDFVETEIKIQNHAHTHDTNRMNLDPPQKIHG